MQRREIPPAPPFAKGGISVKERQKVFLAVPLTSPQLAGIRSFRQGHGRLQGPGFRWMVDENLHLTVFYLGHVLLRDSGPIFDAIRSVLSHCQPFHLHFSRFSLQPARKPRMIWAQYAEDERYSALAHAVAQACQPFLLDRTRQYKRPIPHITLARIKAFAAVTELATDVSLADLRVAYTELWLSETGPRRALYTPLQRFDMARSEG